MKMKRHVRVLHVGPHLAAQGGIASVLGYLDSHRSGFDNLGYSIDFLPTTLSMPAGLQRKVMQFGRAARTLVDCLAKSRVDIVHIHVALRGSLLRKCAFAMLCATWRVPYVFHVHNGTFVDHYRSSSTIKRYLIKQAFTRAARVIALSSQSRIGFVSAGLAEPERCDLVFNGIADPLKGEVSHRSRDALPVMVTFMGLICAAKGCFTLLSALAALPAGLPPFKVQIAGSGEVDALLDSIERNNLTTQVSYVGWVDGEAKDRILRETDIFVLPSRSEGFSVAIVESMAYRCAVVSTRIPGVVDAVRDGVEGVLIPPDDVQVLASALERLIRDGDERSRLADSARLGFLTRFTMDHMAASLCTVYEGVLRQ
jgi:glycosyltransferase involved in cell wall biosynthesis